MALAKKNSKSSGSSAKRKPESFLLCVRNDDYPTSLEVRKLYPTFADSQAQKLDLVRIVDESGSDYLYPADYFVAVRLPQSVKRALAKAS